MFNYFKSVNEVSPEEVREHLSRDKTDSFNLIDVREPEEYESGHLPGAVLMPMGRLKEMAKSLDPTKPTYAY